ncbi:MAG TPA: hypothetical protein VM422_02805 [Amaricoccus sp.]|jgi:hypothetical protein|nr:hypothetical protein [Amaricoccus sp.]
MLKGGPGWKLFAELVRLWLPVLVSVCAISLTVFQAASTRRHARLSVQPRLEWRLVEESRSGVFEISLANVGLGPAIVRSVAIGVDGIPKRLTDLAGCEAIAAALARSREEFDTRCFVQQNDRVVRAGTELPLFRSEPADGHAPADEVELPDYRRFSVTGTYCSFYEDCWEIESSQSPR